MPAPCQMASALARSGMRAILVIDNCNPSTHRAHAEACRSPGSATCLLTIEYDVRDDEPEGPEVFRLEPVLPEVLERLERRARRLAASDRRRAERDPQTLPAVLADGWRGSDSISYVEASLEGNRFPCIIRSKGDQCRSQAAAAPPAPFFPPRSFRPEPVPHLADRSPMHLLC
ncbi:MAG: hypothetical protein JWO15_2378 [Sphingomonadales bacterium]|nr:hypothetical protein [Sphingomonadales bacterium]